MFVILILVSVLGHAAACAGDEDCVDQNAICEFGNCTCEEGFDIINGECTKILGRVCSLNTDCSTSHSMAIQCINSVCTCGHAWFEEENICVSFFGRTCSSQDDCGQSTSLLCKGGECECRDGFKFDGNNCYRVLYSSCKNDMDCPMENAFCQDYDYYAECRCVEGSHSAHGIDCKMQIGGHCGEVSCSLPNHNHMLYCDVGNVCSCLTYYEPNENMTGCSHILGKSCGEDVDCNNHMYQCTNGTCTCAENFMENVDYYGQGICTKEIGMTCHDTYCAMEHAVCDSDNVCTCINGYVEVGGHCQRVVGTECVDDIICMTFDDALCGINNVCECSPGFEDNSGRCVKLLGKVCTSDNDCIHEDIVCSSNGICECRTSLTGFEGTCMRPECTNNIPLLPDINRRMLSYRLNYSFSEPPISDQQLEEKWYSLGRNMILSGSVVPSEGDCGSKYPIYIKGSLTDSELLLMQTSEITKESTIQLDGYSSQTTSIKLRNCSGEIQVYLTKPAVKLAAYCLETRDGTVQTSHVINIHNSNNLMYVRSHLDFRVEQIDEELMEIPFLEFECIQHAVGINQFHFYVQWYADDVLIESYGPLLQRDMYIARLQETTLLSYGYSTGVKIQCSIQLAESQGGMKSRQLFSNILDTRLSIYMYNFIQGGITVSKQIPLGCITKVDSNDTYCELSMMPENSEERCNRSSSIGEPHELCGAVLLGVTKKGQQQFGDLPNSIITNINGTWTHSQYDFMKVLNNITNIKAVFRFTENGLPIHNIWKDSSFLVHKDQTVTDHNMVWSRLHVSGDRVLIYTSGEFVDVYTDSTTVGEYVLYRSRNSPIQINIILDIADYSMRLCGIVYRDHDFVHTQSICNDAIIIGSLTGSGSPTNGYTLYGQELSNGITLTTYTYVSSYGIYEFTLSLYGFQNGHQEGISNMGRNYFPMRNGSVSSTTIGFLNSWRVESDESMLNPYNTRSYRYEFHPVVCPSANETFADRIQQTGNQTWIYYNGAVSVDADSVCMENEQAEEWPSSLMPPFIIEEVSVKAVLYYIADGPVLAFKCIFKSSSEYLYKIKWNVDERTVHESMFLDGTSAEAYAITDDEIVGNDAMFILDSKVTCGVSVFSLSEDRLADFHYSSPFYPVKIQTHIVNLQRGGRAAIRIERNIPFACPLGSEECRLEFRLFDLNDKYDCKDSTIAVISKDSCGFGIHGITVHDTPWDEPDHIDIIITTKNDNAYTLRDTFTLNTSISASEMSNSMWNGRLQDTITVFVRDETFWQGRYCYSNNDPRMGTFDGMHYSNQLVDEFILMRHRVLPIEIQMKTTSCNGGFASCSCAVTIRAGRDVYTINHCDGVHINDYLMHDDQPILTIKRRSANRYQVLVYCLSDDSEAIQPDSPERISVVINYTSVRNPSPVFQKSHWKITIYLPKGTMVDVYVSTWMWYLVNVNIYPSPYDTGNIEGLCGNYNGDRSDDFQHRDGTSTDIGNGYYYYTPNEFSLSWSLIHTEKWEDESLLNVERMEEILENWSDNESLCVCPLGEADTILCSPIEDNTCTEPIEKPGETIEVSNRRKRSPVRRKKDYADQLRKQHEQHVLIAQRVYREVKAANHTNENAITEAEALERCNNSMINNCVLYTMIDESPVQNTDELLLNCARDLAIDASIDWSGETCSRLQAVVEVEISKDTDFQKNNTEFVTFVSENVCVGSCTGNGKCVYGTCKCDEHFSSTDCSIDLRVLPTILRMQGDGICEIQNGDDCTCIDVTTDGSVTNAFCNVDIYLADQSGEFVPQNIERTSAVYHHFNEIMCCVSEPYRKRRSTEAEVLAIRYNISVSNDGVNFGRSMAVHILDTSCLEIIEDSLGNDKATIRPGFCFIGGACIPDGTKNVEDQCQRCSSLSNVFDWSGDQCSRRTDTESQSNAILIAVVTSTTVVVTIAAIAAFWFWKRSKAKRKTWPGQDAKSVRMRPGNGGSVNGRSDGILN